MQIQTLALFSVLLLGFANALPTTDITPLLQRDHDGDHDGDVDDDDDDSSKSYCSDFTFSDTTSFSWPRVTDCQQMIADIADLAGEGAYYVGGVKGGQGTLAAYGTCAFGATYNTHSAAGAAVGNQDIIDLVTDAINRFQTRGLVGARGVMMCDGDKVGWGLYHA